MGRYASARNRLTSSRSFKRICNLFKAADLSVWTDFGPTAAPDQTFNLEDSEIARTGTLIRLLWQ